MLGDDNKNPASEDPMPDVARRDQAIKIQQERAQFYGKIRVQTPKEQERDRPHLYAFLSLLQQTLPDLNVDILLFCIGSYVFPLDPPNDDRTVQECPAFAKEAAAAGKHVVVISLDDQYYYDIPSGLDRTLSTPNLSVYKFGINTYEGSNTMAEEIDNALKGHLKKSPDNKAILAYYASPAINVTLTSKGNFRSFAKAFDDDRIKVISAYSAPAPCFIYEVSRMERLLQNEKQSNDVISATVDILSPDPVDLRAKAERLGLDPNRVFSHISKISAEDLGILRKLQAKKRRTT